MQDWIIIRLKSQQHRRAEDNVRAQETEFYMPRAMMRSPRTRKLRVEPLFPGYAFARPPGEQWVFLNSTIGVLGVLMGTGEEPATLPAVEVERLRAREGEEGIVRLESSEFRRGERLLVDDGPFFGQEGLFDGMAGRDRVYVLLRVLGRQVRTKVEVKSVSRA